MLRAGLALCLMATACTNESEAEVSSLCVESVGEGDEAHLLVTVAFTGCLTSCDSVTESGCSVEGIDGDLVIDAYARIASKGRSCDAICGSIPSVTCEFEPDAGTDVTLSAGDLVLDYSFPSDEKVCTNDAP
jgi:hypothetical protein